MKHAGQLKAGAALDRPDRPARFFPSSYILTFTGPYKPSQEFV